MKIPRFQKVGHFGKIEKNFSNAETAQSVPKNNKSTGVPLIVRFLGPKNYKDFEKNMNKKKSEIFRKFPEIFQHLLKKPY